MLFFECNNLLKTVGKIKIVFLIFFFTCLIVLKINKFFKIFTFMPNSFKDFNYIIIYIVKNIFFHGAPSCVNIFFFIININ
uniref:Uncharacterized protein n=1 Tax=Lotharella vacuolata TaxID=74820 RepID=A0A0H5BHF9_9EUKA|nr:hypothetical protein [Lotharella vacuolata]